MNIHKIKTWFTLVELIVVITILAILATLSFVSFTWYLSSTRDSKRAVDINNINKSFEIAKITSGKIVFPDKNIDITLSGSLVWNQWDIKDQTLSFIWVSDEAFDPLDSKPYQFFSNAQKTKFQIVSFFENIENSQLAYVSSAFADSDYRNRYPFYKGDWLGFILNENNEPIHWENAIQTAGNYELADLTLWGNWDKIIKPIFSNSLQKDYKSFLISGQINIAANLQGVLSPESCPDNFIHVPGNSDLWQPPFCIWKYEASYSASSKHDALQTLAGKMPAVELPITDAPLTDCRWNGPGYHVMTVNERLTVAQNIEAQYQNWTSWIVGNGYIKTGNSGNNASGFSGTVSRPLNGESTFILPSGPSWNITQDNLRQLELSNGEIIWDFAGNAWEIISPLGWTHLGKNDESELYKIYKYTGNNTVRQLFTNYNLWINYSSKILWKDYTWDLDGKLVSPTYNVWAGSIYNTNWAYSFFVGWDNNESLAFENWLFSLWYVSGYTYRNVTTRCAYTGN